jgi:peptide/nickel transport system ATP-binding protein
MTDPMLAGDRQERIPTLVEITSLRKYFPIEKGFFNRLIGEVKAVNDVSLSIRQGETLALVGESGCGKSTLGRCVLRAIEPTSGTVRLRSRDTGEYVNISGLGKSQLRQMRREMQMVFQDPNSSLDPRMTVAEIIGEPLWAPSIMKGEALRQRVREVAGLVGLRTEYLSRYPHAFSGGQRQRIGIARALVTNPQFIVADEPVSALDVSVQAQILNLLQDLQQQMNLTYLFVSHDLSVVRHVADRVAVMYLGNVVELAPAHELFENPRHPYTAALMAVVPRGKPGKRRQRSALQGEVANPANTPTGCPFHPRCQFAQDICRQTRPELTEVSAAHQAACHFAGTLDLEGIPAS